MLLNFKKSQDGRASLPTELNPTCEHEDETVSVTHQEHQDRGGREERHGLLQEGQRGIRRVQPVAQVRLRVREPDVHDTKQYMMYKKAEMFDDTEVMREIINTPDDHPQRAQENGKDGQELQRARMAPQNRDLMKMLLDASDKELVEASPYDRIWGIGFDKAHAAADVTNWGSNKFERSLLEVRAMINDMLRLMPNGMTGSIPVTTTTLAFCDVCACITMISNTSLDTEVTRAQLMITTCGSCARRFGVTFGSMGGQDLMGIYEIIHKKVELSSVGPVSCRKFHPDVLRLLNTNDCMITEGGRLQGPERGSDQELESGDHGGRVMRTTMVHTLFEFENTGD
ncbi:hypothetical protein N7522_005150 [Penicillium canescens]|nr:hypothetical protein N7522_005150 [Penicillium canescens]